MSVSATNRAVCRSQSIARPHWWMGSIMGTGTVHSHPPWPQVEEDPTQSRANSRCVNESSCSYAGSTLSQRSDFTSVIVPCFVNMNKTAGVKMAGKAVELFAFPATSFTLLTRACHCAGACG
jgi:hypothetical protein